MKIFKNPKKLRISKTLRELKDKITLEKIIKDLCNGITIGLSYTLFCLALISICLNMLVFSTFSSLLIFSGIYGGVIGLISAYIRYKKNKVASENINEIIETMKENNIELKKEEINDKVKVVELENNKGYEKLENGKYKKRKKVVNYISIKDKEKYKILKEVTTYVRNIFYKIYEEKTYIMDDQDLVNEGFIDEIGKVTEKGKILNLK